MSAGRLIAIVGPSGVGKDSVMRALVARRPEMHLVRRVITRAPDARGEVFDSATPADFAAREAAGAFVLSWQAHGLSYGIPSQVGQVVATGGDAVVNLSRGVLGRAAERFEKLRVICLTADAATLARRLAARGREAPEEIARRLDRAGFALPATPPAILIDNTGPLDDTVAAILTHLLPAKV